MLKCLGGKKKQNDVFHHEYKLLNHYQKCNMKTGSSKTSLVKNHGTCFYLVA